MGYIISLGVGFGVGLLYWLLKVQSPAPPLIALAGLLGMDARRTRDPCREGPALHAERGGPKRRCRPQRMAPRKNRRSRRVPPERGWLIPG